MSGGRGQVTALDADCRRFHLYSGSIAGAGPGILGSHASIRLPRRHAARLLHRQRGDVEHPVSAARHQQRKRAARRGDRRGRRALALGLAPPKRHDLDAKSLGAPSLKGIGQAHALSGTRAALGAAEESSLAGAVATLTWNGTSWQPESTLTLTPTIPGARFGKSVGLSGDTLVVAAPEVKVGSFPQAGSVYVFFGRRRLDRGSRDLRAQGGGMGPRTIAVGAAPGSARHAARHGRSDADRAAPAELGRLEHGVDLRALAVRRGMQLHRVRPMRHGRVRGRRVLRGLRPHRRGRRRASGERRRGRQRGHRGRGG